MLAMFFFSTLGIQNKTKKESAAHSPTSAKSILMSFAFSGKRKSRKTNSTPKINSQTYCIDPFLRKFRAKVLSVLA
jgi:hypothetical protein